MEGTRIRLRDLQQKVVKKEYTGDNSIYIQDIDNLYPYRIKALIEGSKTAFRASRLMSKFIVGEGLREGLQSNLYDKIVDQTNNLDIHSFSFQLAKSISYQDGFFVHVSYAIVDGEIKPSHICNIPFEDARICKKDDDGFLGRLKVKNWRDSNSFSRGQDKKESNYYSFSLDQKVLETQIFDCYSKFLKRKNNSKVKDSDVSIEEAIKVFTGQYYYYNPNIGEVYPLAKIHATQQDADTEFRIANYTNSQLRRGFMGKTIFKSLGLTAEDEDLLNDMLYNLLGEENASDILYYPIETLADGVEVKDVLTFEQIKPQFDEKFFEQTKKDTKSDLMSAFNNIPEAFISSSESFFGTSGEAFLEMKKYYSEQNDEERKAIYKFWLDVFGYEIEFKTYGNE